MSSEPSLDRVVETRRVYVIQRRHGDGWVDTSGSYGTDQAQWEAFKTDYRVTVEIFGAEEVRPVYRRTETREQVIMISGEET